VKVSKPIKEEHFPQLRMHIMRVLEQSQEKPSNKRNQHVYLSINSRSPAKFPSGTSQID
jgi:hypothetical protein